MTPKKMYEMLKPVQEEKGFYFNPDLDWVIDVLGGVLANKDRYGYGSCPCRLATGDKQIDQVIICPCVFRDDDVAEYDRCYCELYYSQAAVEGRTKVPPVIPERWLRK